MTDLKFPAIFQLTSGSSVPVSPRHLTAEDITSGLYSFVSDLRGDQETFVEDSNLSENDIYEYYYSEETEPETILSKIGSSSISTTQKPPPTIWFPSDSSCPDNNMKKGKIKKAFIDLVLKPTGKNVPTFQTLGTSTRSSCLHSCFPCST